MNRGVTNNTLSLLERTLLDRIQTDFPLDESPYESLSRMLNGSPQQILNAVNSLRQRGIIRRIGGSFVPAALGYISTLVAARVERTSIESAATVASGFPEVTHNYERDSAYNLWFTVIAASQARIDEILRAVRSCKGVRSVHSLPAVRTFKLQVDFIFERAAQTIAATTAASAPQRLDEDDRRIIARASGDLPSSIHPFRDMAAELGYSSAFLLARLRGYRQRGILRRFGAVLSHQLAGFVANGMSVWSISDASLESLVGALVARSEVSHCYERPTMPDWPYRIYAMIHGHSRRQCLEVAQQVAQESGTTDYRVLFSLREFKKSSWQYDPDAQ